MFATKLDCLVQVLLFVVVPAPDLSREHGDCLSLSLFPRMILILTQDSRQSSYVIVHGMWCQWWSIAFLPLTTFGLCLPTQSKDEQDWTGTCIVILGNMCRTFTNKMWPVLVLQYYFPIFSDQRSCSWNQDTKFCLHAAGGISVGQNFINSGGEIEIARSRASFGGAVLRSTSGVFGRILR